MNKRKIALLAMSACMIAILAIGGTLAYFTDTESAENVFTFGSLSIKLNEDQRKLDADNNPTADLEDFDDDKLLLPIVGSAQGADFVVDNSDYEGVAEWKVPSKEKAKNWVDKIVSVTNIKDEAQDAYVRVLIAFPAQLDDASASNMIMHWNQEYNADTVWTISDAGVQITKDEVYNIYSFVYEPRLAGGETTKYPAITGVYIDSRINAEQDENGNITYFFPNADGSKGKSATYAADNGPKLYVVAQAVQAEGFANATEALTEAFGVPTVELCNTWFANVQ